MDTGLALTTGDALTVSASGSWASDAGFGLTGPDGYEQPWPDNFLNLTDIGTGGSTPTLHYGALIGYIGSAPPPAGSYGAEEIRPEAEKVFLVGSSYSAFAPLTGELWLNFNDDAYSGNTSDNYGPGVTATVSVSPTQADLALTKTAPSSLPPGKQTFTYEITVTNHGQADATEVTMTDPLPSAVTLQGAPITSQGSCTTAQTVVCILGSLANGQSASVSLNVMTVPPSLPNTNITNTASVKANEPDPNQANNSASVTTAVKSANTCPYRIGGKGVTFYPEANYKGKSWTAHVPPGDVDTYFNLPSGIAGHLGSFREEGKDPNAWHVVLYQGPNGTGNLGHYDASWPNVDAYWQNMQSVKIYLTRVC